MYIHSSYFSSRGHLHSRGHRPRQPGSRGGRQRGRAPRYYYYRLFIYIYIYILLLLLLLLLLYVLLLLLYVLLRLLYVLVLLLYVLLLLLYVLLLLLLLLLAAAGDPQQPATPEPDRLRKLCACPGIEAGGGYSWTGNTFRESVSQPGIEPGGGYSWIGNTVRVCAWASWPLGSWE